MEPTTHSQDVYKKRFTRFPTNWNLSADRTEEHMTLMSKKRQLPEFTRPIYTELQQGFSKMFPAAELKKTPIPTADYRSGFSVYLPDIGHIIEVELTPANHEDPSAVSSIWVGVNRQRIEKISPLEQGIHRQVLDLVEQTMVYAGTNRRSDLESDTESYFQN